VRLITSFHACKHMGSPKPSQHGLGLSLLRCFCNDGWLLSSPITGSRGPCVARHPPVRFCGPKRVHTCFWTVHTCFWAVRSGLCEQGATLAPHDQQKQEEGQHAPHRQNCQGVPVLRWLADFIATHLKEEKGKKLRLVSKTDQSIQVVITL